MDVNLENPPLEIFCAHPYFWTPPEICMLWLETGIEYQNSSLKQRNDALFHIKNQVLEFLPSGNLAQSFDILAIKESVLGPENDWRIALDKIDNLLGGTPNSSGKGLFYYLSTTFKNGMDPSEQEKRNTQSRRKKQELSKSHTSRLSNLMIALRNKLAHAGDLPPSGREALGNLEVANTCKNSKEFVQLIITAFPKLVPFVGLNKGKLNHNVSRYKHIFGYNLESFLSQLSQAMHRNLITGGLEKRYVGPNPTNLTLEFRKVNGTVNMPGNIIAMAAIICNGKMRIVWSDGNRKDELIYGILGNSTLENICIIFKRAGENLDLLVLEDKYTRHTVIISSETVKNCNEIVHALSHKYKCRLTEVEISWQDVLQWQNVVLKQHVTFNNSRVSIDSILPQGDREKELVLKTLNGDELNDILKGNAPQIFDLYALPPKLSIYISRLLLLNFRWYENCNVDCMRHEGENSIKWLGFKDSTSVLNVYRSLTTDDYTFSEDILLHILPEQVRSVILSNEPGMGKSALFINTAHNLAEKYSDRIVALVETQQFVNQLEKGFTKTSRAITSDIVLNTLADLGCQSNFKKQVAKLLLLKQLSSHLKFELMFDGLDEAKRESKLLILDTVKHILEEMPTIRVWISTRDHLVLDQQTVANSLHMRMKPFSRHQQIDYVYEQMQKYIKNNAQSEAIVPSEDELKLFAEKCTNVKIVDSNIDIAGIPLQCFMIFQVYAEKLLQNDLNVKENASNSLVQLYKNFLEQKFVVCLKKTGLNFKTDMLKHPIYQDMYHLMLQRHTYWALKLLFSDRVANDYQEYAHLNIKNVNDFLKLVLPYGLVESIQPVRFVHRTISEYLVAYTIMQDLEKGMHNNTTHAETQFLRFVWEKCLGFVKTVDTKYPEFYNPTIAYFVDSCLSLFINPNVDILDEDETDCEEYLYLALNEKVVNPKFTDLLFSKILKFYYPRTNRDEFGEVFELEIGPPSCGNRGCDGISALFPISFCILI